MKGKTILVFLIALIFGFIVYPMKATLFSASLAQEDSMNTESLEQASQDEVVVKTYFLKYIKPIKILSAGKLYLIDSTSTEDIITVRIRKKDIPKFEELLKKLDIERRTVLIKVFTVVASRKQEKQEDEAIEDKGLKKVLDELNSLWKFQSYKIDGPSFLTVKDGSGSNFFRLVTTYSNLNMYTLHVNVRGEKPGNRIISIGQISLRWVSTFSGKDEQTLISTNDVTLKENGYLVVGVSGYPFGGGSGKALILVISAEIK